MYQRQQHIRSAVWGSLFPAVATAYLVFVFAYLIAPILIAAGTSFNPQRLIVFPPAGFSVRWYVSYIHDPIWRRAIVNTVVIGSICAGVATLVGTLTAYGISRIRLSGWRDAVFVIFLVPLVIPYMTLAMALYPIYAKLGLIGTQVGVALAQAVIAMPYVVIAVTASLRGRDQVLESAARTLGATPARAFWYVVIPLVRPGMAAGAVLAFMASFDDVVMPLFLGGIGAGTVPKAMLEALYNVSDPSVMAVSTSISVVGLLLLMLALMLGGRRPR